MVEGKIDFISSLICRGPIRRYILVIATLEWVKEDTPVRPCIYWPRASMPPANGSTWLWKFILTLSVHLLQEAHLHRSNQRLCVQLKTFSSTMLLKCVSAVRPSMKLFPSVISVGIRPLSTRNQPESTFLRDPVRQVFISQSNDVFTNLALEDWLYQHHDFDHKVMLVI